MLAGCCRIWATITDLVHRDGQNRTFCAGALPESSSDAVFIATTWRTELTSGPPELPGLNGCIGLDQPGQFSSCRCRS